LAPGKRAPGLILALPPFFCKFYKRPDVLRVAARREYSAIRLCAVKKERGGESLLAAHPEVSMQIVERSVLPSDEISVILGALNALKRGDASVRLPADWQGTLGRVSDVFNDVVERNEHMAQELERLSRVVGKEGKLGKRGTLGDVTGFWRDSIDAVNLLIDDLVHPTSETARVIGAVA
jgi:hypothetical protein